MIIFPLGEKEEDEKENEGKEEDVLRGVLVAKGGRASSKESQVASDYISSQGERGG